MSIRLAELLLEAGLPEGVLQVVNGDKEAVDAARAIKMCQQLVLLDQHQLQNIFMKIVQKMKKEFRH